MGILKLNVSQFEGMCFPCWFAGSEIVLHEFNFVFFIASIMLSSLFPVRDCFVHLLCNEL